MPEIKSCEKCKSLNRKIRFHGSRAKDLSRLGYTPWASVFFTKDGICETKLMHVSLKPFNEPFAKPLCEFIGEQLNELKRISRRYP